MPLWLLWLLQEMWLCYHIVFIKLRKEEPPVILEILRNLAGVRRFDMAVMFMSNPEKKGTDLVVDLAQFVITLFNPNAKLLYDIDNCKLFVFSSSTRIVWLSSSSWTWGHISRSPAKEVWSVMWVQNPKNGHYHREQNWCLLQEAIDWSSVFQCSSTCY